MILTEENFQEKIIGFSKVEWAPLLTLIPLIEGTTKFGEVKGGNQVAEGLYTIPYMDQAKIVSEFTKIVYEMPIMINFDWGSWDDGREIASDENFDYDTIDIPTKCKLITAIVRNDRFCEGALVEAFESGLILKLLKSIEKQIG